VGTDRDVEERRGLHGPDSGDGVQPDARLSSSPASLPNRSHVPDIEQVADALWEAMKNPRGNLPWTPRRPGNLSALDAVAHAAKFLLEAKRRDARHPLPLGCTRNPETCAWCAEVANLKKRWLEALLALRT
jgi:hypothetical protein